MWIFTFTSLLLIATSLFLYYQVKEIVFGAVDRTLHSKAQVVSGLLHEEHGTVELELTEVVSGEYSIPRSGHYYKVLMGGKVLAASPSLVDSDFNLAAGTLKSRDTVLKETVLTSIGPAGEPIRVLQHDLDAFGTTFRIYVAESMVDSLDMVETFRRFLLMVIPAAILLVSLMAMWLARRSLKPIEVFSRRVTAITHMNLGERINAGVEAEELTGLADSFNDMLDRLQMAFDSEKRLFADASHELKTPLSVIKLQCDVALQRERTLGDYVKALQTVKIVSDRMDALVKNLLSLARLDSGILSSQAFTEVSLIDCIRDAVTMVQPIAEARSIQIVTSLSEDISIMGDAESLTEMFLNLLENGVKYNRDKGKIEVSTSRKEAEAVVAIKDTGVGMSKQDAARVFDRFYRADAVRNTDGTGLGLSIAKVIVEAHSGKITLESEPGKGSTFTVTLSGGRGGCC